MAVEFHRPSVEVDRRRQGQQTEDGHEFEGDPVGKSQVECDDYQRRKREVEVEGWEAGEPVVGPAENSPLRKKIVTQIGGPEDMGSHVAACRSVGCEDQPRVHHNEDDQRRPDHQDNGQHRDLAEPSP